MAPEGKNGCLIENNIEIKHIMLYHSLFSSSFSGFILRLQLFQVVSGLKDISDYNCSVWHVNTSKLKIDQLCG